MKDFKARKIAPVATFFLEKIYLPIHNFSENNQGAHMETHNASPAMQKFFEKLLALKHDLKAILDHEQGMQEDMLIKLYERFDEIIKEKNENA